MATVDASSMSAMLDQSGVDFSRVCLFCMSPVVAGATYCSDECEHDDAEGAHPSRDPSSSDYSPVPPLVPGASDSCSSTPSSTNNSPAQLALLAGQEEPTSLALPPSMASKQPLHFNYRYSYGEVKDGATSPPFAPSSADGRSSSKSSSVTPDAHISRTLTGLGPPPSALPLSSTAPALTLASRRTSLVSPRLRPLGQSPHASPALRPLTALSNLTLTRSRHESPTLRPQTSRSVGAADMSRRSSVPLETTFESDNEADDEAGASAFADYLFAKSRRPSEIDHSRRRAGTAAPSTSPVSRSAVVEPPLQTPSLGQPRRYLFGRATPSPVPSDEDQLPAQLRGRSQQRQQGSSAYRSISPKLRARSGSNQRDGETAQDAFERGRRARRRVSRS